MARQDIHVNSLYGEVNTTENLTNKTIYKLVLFDYMDGLDNDRYCYGEITVPDDFETKYTIEKEIRISATYKPCYKELFVRFAIINNNGSVEYLINRTNNKIWFPVQKLNDNNISEIIRYSELFQINEQGNFNLILEDGFLAVFSSCETDFEIKAALKQNEVFLLKAFPGNLYQFPSTGVGLIDFLHGNFENTGLAAKLQSEFENDGMIINNAFMDSATGELLLDVSEKKENG